ncbi:hypothetical protein GIS00_20450 [Nakamurella sp. YIM 132087]|uniref:Acyl-CoA dehydrogenase/oxidase C-terminal domain-containing protein n=1 Tax=Nakamurella alba TaxID=2665158 RepID=A0A7K1FQ88_9ACTN|nr:acyl-CoA dehydrogenase family protein [Nakamurella alba]MTD16315.1 hypothetical protein [Nakamurella alba]
MTDTELRESVRELCRALVADSAAAGLSAETLITAGWPDILEEETALAVGALQEAAGAAAAVTAGASLLATHVLAGRLGADAAVTVLSGRVSPGPAGAVVDAVRRGAERPATHLLVVDHRAAGSGAVLVGVGAAHLEVSPTTGIDPRAAMFRITGPVHTSDGAEGSGTDDDVGRAGLLVRLAVAHERIGLAAAALDLALAHVRDRYQFGRSIGSYQAVQHRLVDAHVAITSAGAAASQAWSGTTPIAVAVAAHQAAVAARTTTAAALQVCGGMAYTEEFGLGALARSALLHDGLHGDPELLAARVATCLQDAGGIIRSADFDHGGRVAAAQGGHR